jgi:Domain of unknown function (DUF4136)
VSRRFGAAGAWAGGALACALAFAAGCGSTSVVNQRDKTATFERYGSFSIEPGPVTTDDAVTAGPNQLAQKRVNDVIGTEMSAKGLALAKPEDADLIVTYTASERDRQEIVRGREGPVIGTFSGTDLWLQDYREARLVIDVIDASAQKVVWRSTARGLNQTFRDPEFVRKTVVEALTGFPQARAKSLESQ